ncbi:MAG: bifunctional adenosylcobinamide kinase/adenosylcobinamide-phosphate guanylyltransferase [Oscillospiraceae bacterium]|nr:bifunctional adenosylcobinamide kinase/adenosylcobinamide-phosphate guanylyltransferase [Oscillospiraceae bacterium]
MIMITGGSFQGKIKFAAEHFNINKNDILSGENCRFDNVFSAKCVSNFQYLIKRLIENKIDPVEFTQKLCRDNPKAVIIINEIGCGIIPIEKSERIWREQTGRAGCIVAEKASAVIRICCGIPTIIKGEIK